MTIIVVGNEKGGTGKTTIAVNIAAMAARQGKDVLLIDCDPGQQSAAKWASLRADLHPEAPAVHCVTLLVTGKQLQFLKQLEDLGRRYSQIVVDTGAVDSQELRAAMVLATWLVVPVQGEAFDLWTLPTMERLFSMGKRENQGLDSIIVLNRVPHQLRGKTPGETDSWIADNTPSVPQRVIPVVGRTAYGKASAEGLSIWEMRKRDPRAATEMQRLYREVSNGN